MPTWWAERAWLGGPATTAAVLLEVKEDRLATVTPGVTTPPADARVLRGLTLPGLANAHSHAFHRALRGRTHEERGSFWSWRDLMYRVADRLDPDSYLRLARAVFAEMALAGFTAVGEFHYLHHGRNGVRYADANQMGLAVMEAAAQAGVRLTLLDTCYLQGGFSARLQGPQLRFGDGDAAGWSSRVADLAPTSGCRIGAAIHSVRAVPADQMSLVAAWAAEAAAPLHAHVSEQRREHDECIALYGRTPLGLLAEAGAVDDRFTAVHGTHLSVDDIGSLSNCCVCPTTERDLGDGIGPFAELAEAGVRLSIGTDSHAVIDGFEEARGIETAARLAAERRGLLPPDLLLEAATSGGMEMLGWESGRLAGGYLADFVTVRLDSVRTAGADSALAATAVFSATAADVTTVVVGGRPIVDDGRHLTVKDVPGELASSIAELLS